MDFNYQDYYTLCKECTWLEDELFMTGLEKGKHDVRYYALRDALRHAVDKRINYWIDNELCINGLDQWLQENQL